MAKIRIFSGFTIVEVMIVTAVVALLAIISIPSFLSAQQDARAEQIAIELIDTINYARQSALRGYKTRLCGINNSNDLTDLTCASAFTNGWNLQIQNNGANYNSLATYQKRLNATDITGAANQDLFLAGGAPAFNSTLTWTIKPSKCNKGRIVTMDSYGNLTNTSEQC